MTQLLKTALLALALSIPAAALAQSGDIDQRIDAVKADIKEDKAALKDDKKDLKTISKLRKKWEKARESDNAKKEHKLDPDIMSFLTEEVGESRREAREARGELVAGGGEIEERRTAGVKPRADGTIPGAKPGSGGPGIDDNPAQADDRADMATARGDLRRTKEIAEELREIQQRFRTETAGPKLYKEKSRLLAELEQGAERDLRRSERELEEDGAQLDKLKERKKGK